MSTVENEVWVTRATAWELAAFSFRYPTGELAQAIVSGEWAAAAREVLDALGIQAPGELEENLSGLAAACRDIAPEALLHRLRVEATRLFVGPSTPACSPYEGVWRAKAEGVEPLLFVNPHSMAVERFVRARGFKGSEGGNEPFDHIVAECELLEVLAFQAANASSDSSLLRGNADLSGEAPETAYDEFICNHGSQWMPGFARELRARAQHSFYCAAAEYLVVLLGAHGL